MDEKIKKIQALFTKAEQRIKKVESFSEGLCVPAVNELRYVGFHLLRALQSGAEEEFKRHEFEKAENHCARAIYDASEMGVFYCLKQIRTFNEDYKNIVITDILPDYGDCLTLAEDAKDLLTNKICANAIDEREKHYKEMDAHFIELEKWPKRLTAIRPEANKEIDRINRKNLTAATMIFLAALGVIVAILFH